MRTARGYSHDHSITLKVLSLVCPSFQGFENSNSCLWNLCSYVLVYSIDWVQQRLDIFSFQLLKELSLLWSPVCGSEIVSRGDDNPISLFLGIVSGQLVILHVHVLYNIENKSKAAEPSQETGCRVNQIDIAWVDISSTNMTFNFVEQQTY